MYFRVANICIGLVAFVLVFPAATSISSDLTPGLASPLFDHCSLYVRPCSQDHDCMNCINVLQYISVYPASAFPSNATCTEYSDYWFYQGSCSFSEGGTFAALMLCGVNNNGLNCDSNFEDTTATPAIDTGGGGEPNLVAGLQSTFFTACPLQVDACGKDSYCTECMSAMTNVWELYYIYMPDNVPCTDWPKDFGYLGVDKCLTQDVLFITLMTCAVFNFQGVNCTSFQ